jgi:hypothetical protein
MVQRVLVSFVLTILLSCTLIPDNALAGAEEKFLLFYSNDIEGETEPCG